VLEPAYAAFFDFHESKDHQPSDVLHEFASVLRQ
jgi:hypothetical protein